jgi:hypothetical protein
MTPRQRLKLTEVLHDFAAAAGEPHDVLNPPLSSRGRGCRHPSGVTTGGSGTLFLLDSSLRGWCRPGGLVRSGSACSLLRRSLLRSGSGRAGLVSVRLSRGRSRAAFVNSDAGVIAAPAAKVAAKVLMSFMIRSSRFCESDVAAVTYEP